MYRVIVDEIYQLSVILIPSIMLKELEMMIRMLMTLSEKNFSELKLGVLLKSMDHTKNRGLNWREH